MLFSSSILINFENFFVYWTGVLVPQNVKEIVKVDSKAMFILLVEKDAAFQKLLDDGAQTRFGPCIIITVCFVLYFCSNCYITTTQLYEYSTTKTELSYIIISCQINMFLEKSHKMKNKHELLVGS